MQVNDFSMFAGDTRRLEVTVVDKDGVVVDLSLASKIRWWFAKTVKSTPLLMKSLTNAGVEIIDAATGRFNVLLETEDTETFRPGDYYHEAEVIISNSPEVIVSTVFNGTCTILATLVKPESP